MINESSDDSRAGSFAETVPLGLLQKIDLICEEFIGAWNAGLQPRIESYLTRVTPDARSRLLCELLAEEIRFRRSVGHNPSPSEYQHRFPNEPAVITAFCHQAQSAESEAIGSISTSNNTFERQSDDAPSLPTQIGRYRVIRRLGRGGFGIVYLGSDPDLHREVALKVPRPDRFGSDQDLQRFLDEARTAARLNHPGIVSIYDIFRDGAAVCVVQEYVPGLDLSKWLVRHRPRLEPNQIATLVADLAEIIAFAHQQGFVHRDLKPANILMDPKGRVRIADFGLALHESERRSAGDRSGTPSYMSPEQARGDSRQLDGRSDIWSLGVILYELLTGRRPFTGKTHRDLHEDILHAEPKPPRQINPELPAELERICLKCLSKDMTHRYTTGNDLAAELRAIATNGRLGTNSDSNSLTLAQLSSDQKLPLHTVGVPRFVANLKSGTIGCTISIVSFVLLVGLILAPIYFNQTQWLISENTTNKQSDHSQIERSLEKPIIPELPFPTKAPKPPLKPGIPTQLPQFEAPMPSQRPEVPKPSQKSEFPKQPSPPEVRTQLDTEPKLPVPTASLFAAAPWYLRLPSLTSSTSEMLFKLTSEPNEPLTIVLWTDAAALPANSTLSIQPGPGENEWIIELAKQSAGEKNKTTLGHLRRKGLALSFSWSLPARDIDVQRQLANCLLEMSVGDESRAIQLREPLTVPALAIDFDHDRQNLELNVNDPPHASKLLVKFHELDSFSRGAKIRGDNDTVPLSRPIEIQLTDIKGPEVEFRFVRVPSDKLVIQVRPQFIEAANRKFDLTVPSLEKFTRAQERIRSEAQDTISTAKANFATAQANLQSLRDNPPNDVQSRAVWNSRVSAATTAMNKFSGIIAIANEKLAEAQSRLGAVPEIRELIDSHRAARIKFSIFAKVGPHELVLVEGLGQ